MTEAPKSVRTFRRAAALVLASVLASVAALPACVAPVKTEPSKEAQLAMLKDPGYYAEEEYDGRWYVFGNEKTHAQFANTHSIQIARTFIGEGPGGATVVFEAKDKLPEMTDRLVATFSERHGLALR